MEEDLGEFLLELVKCGLFGFASICLYGFLKVIVAAMICKHKDLSNEKVKYITKMFSKK